MSNYIIGKKLSIISTKKKKKKGKFNNFIHKKINRLVMKMFVLNILLEYYSFKNNFKLLK